MSGLRMGHNTEYLYKVNLKKKDFEGDLWQKETTGRNTHLHIFEYLVYTHVYFKNLYIFSWAIFRHWNLQFTNLDGGGVKCVSETEEINRINPDFVSSNIAY